MKFYTRWQIDHTRKKEQDLRKYLPVQTWFYFSLFINKLIEKKNIYSDRILAVSLVDSTLTVADCA